MALDTMRGHIRPQATETLKVLRYCLTVVSCFPQRLPDLNRQYTHASSCLKSSPVSPNSNHKSIHYSSPHTPRLQQPLVGTKASSLLRLHDHTQDTPH